MLNICFCIKLDSQLLPNNAANQAELVHFYFVMNILYSVIIFSSTNKSYLYHFLKKIIMNWKYVFHILMNIIIEILSPCKARKLLHKCLVLYYF